MQYKSARPCFSIFSKKNLLGAIACVLFLVPMMASAMTAIPISKIPSSFGVTLNNGYNSAYYYPIYITPGAVNDLQTPPTGIAKIGVIDPLSTFVDLGQDPDPSLDMQTQDGIIIFNVLATTAVTGQAVLTATMTTTGNTSLFVPIIGFGVNNVMSGCENNYGCLPQGATNPKTGHPLYYGVYYNPNVTFQIAVSPTAFCESLNLNSQPGSYCTGSFFSAGGSPTGPVQTMQFAFNVFPASALPPGPNIPFNQPVPTGQTDSTTVIMDFVSLNPTPVTSASPIPSPSPSPTLNCDLAEGVIAPQPGGFALQEPQNFTLQNDPTNSIGQLIAVGIPTPGPLNTTLGGYPSNPVVDYGLLIPSVGQYFGSFKPSTSASAIYYDVGFLAEDPAGFIINDGGGSGQCTFPGVFSTAVVNGFLQQSKCFIATAAFRDLNTTPLVLLRNFRDRFLEKFSLGRSFVHWYYAWSPDAAEWLIDHPVFRFPVLLALIPLQAFAWLILHPYTLMVLLLMGVSTVLWEILLRRSTE